MSLVDRVHDEWHDSFSFDPRKNFVVDISYGVEGLRIVRIGSKLLKCPNQLVINNEIS